MWCEPRKNGVVYRERYKDPLTEKNKVVTVFKSKDTAQNRNKAHRELSAKIEVLIQATQSKNVSVTLSRLQSEYLKAQALTYKQSTVTRNRIITSLVIDLLNPDAVVENLTAQYVNSVLLSSGKQASTLNTYVTRFKAMLNWGYINDYHDNVKLIEKLKHFTDNTEEKKIKLKYLEPDEAQKLLNYIKDSDNWHWYYTSSILLLTGLRFGELAALEVSDINLHDLEIRISKTYDSNNNVVTTPKTDNSMRTIHIQPDLLAELKKCMLWRNELMLANDFRSGLLIPNIKTGDHMQHAAYNKYLRETSEKLLRRRVTPHMLRHTHASLLAANGMIPDEIARRLGHSKSSVTSEIYIHVTQKVIEHDNQKLDQIKLFS